jgi:hypothetical protein
MTDTVLWTSFYVLIALVVVAALARLFSRRSSSSRGPRRR